MYLALHTNIPGMETIPSNWDQQTVIENAGTLTLRTTYNNISNYFKNTQTNAFLPRHKKRVNPRQQRRQVQGNAGQTQCHLANLNQRDIRQTCQRQSRLCRKNKIELYTHSTLIFLASKYAYIRIIFYIFSDKSIKYVSRCQLSALIQKALLTSGNVETNPGPTIIQEPNLVELLFTVDAHNPEIIWEDETPADFTIDPFLLYDIQHFDLEEFMINRQGWEHGKKLCHNILFSCDTCESLESCLRIFLAMYVKRKVTLSNALINKLSYICLYVLRCMYCLMSTKQFIWNFMPKGTICGDKCEQDFMTKFILPWSHSKHRICALWIKHLGLKTMNNIGRVPMCKEHFNYKICFADSISKEGIKTWIMHADNTIKVRKKRDCIKCTAIADQDIAKDMLQLASGAICAGRNCYKTLWLYTGPSEQDSWDLQYCTPTYLRTRRRREKEYHNNKIYIIQQCIEEQYNLIHIDIFQAPKLGGSSLHKQLEAFNTHGFKTRIKTTNPGKVLVLT